MADRLEKYISSLESLAALKDESQEGSIRWYIQWYAQRYPFRRILYRSSGIVLLLIALFAASQLHAIASLTTPAILVAVTAFVIGLTTFFSWGTAWRGYFQTKVRLEFLMQGWEATLLEARVTLDEEKAIEIVCTRLKELLKQASEAIAEETTLFFDSIKFPSIDNNK
jgi:hypothetical protein